MNEEIIRNYASLMKELDLSGLEICEKDTKIRLERGVSAMIQNSTPASSAKVPEDTISGETGGDPVKSPMVGVFYAAPAENADPFVKVGDRVKRGDTLCIIEAMKLMNEVQAEREGTIQKICVKNADTVEYGTVLFLIGD